MTQAIPLRLFTTLLLFALVACSRSVAPSENRSLTGACQFRKCECRKQDTAFWQAGDAIPVNWAIDGSATCPPGYALKVIEKQKTLY
jgi:hypothetical protein